MARAVEMAVRLTESSILALLSEDMKLLILPLDKLLQVSFPLPSKRYGRPENKCQQEGEKRQQNKLTGHS